MTDYLHHVMLTTGDVTRMPRDGISDDDIGAIAEMLDGVLLGGVLPAPGAEEYLVNGSHHRDNLMVTLWRGPWPKRTAVLTTAVARGPGPALTLWREMHRSARVPLATDTGNPPPEPWIADRVEANAVAYAAEASRIGDWSRRLGWAWMDYGR
ncbi:hypothetical protein FHS82_001617 [Pseudochelatococcus lubricantis]|uniref:Uncharacterized protein n=1 Tax=Pseudochelatococcus lubricantis TaxID=1538102 RepID=A0ABX0UXW7_9HYPH|nr:hypothetical protein [Pseudochelatococcus lubricantis]NIJ57781.1 hypothetical protein [Pseudochelatococcus lubricantis]